MKKMSQEVLAGAFILIGIAAMVRFASMTGADLLPDGDTYTVIARFTDVGGLKSGSPVRIAGVSVGKVGTIKIDTNFSALVELRVRKDLILPSDTMASVKTSGLIGEKYLALAPGAQDRLIGAGGMLVDTESALDIESLIRKFAFGSVK